METLTKTASASGNGMFQVLREVASLPPYFPVKTSFLPSRFSRAFPPITLWKGSTMQDPTHGSFGPFHAPTKTLYPTAQTKNPVDAKALPLEWILDPSKGSSIFDRILARLVQSEAREVEAVYRDDYRISWLTVRFCQTGEAVQCTPQVLATYKVLGCHPDQVWFRINAQRVAMLGKCRIGATAIKSATGEASPVPQNPMSLSGSISPKKANQSAKKEDVA